MAAPSDITAGIPVSGESFVIVIVLFDALDIDISEPSTKVIVPAAAPVLVSFNVIIFAALVKVYVLLSPVESTRQAGLPLVSVFQTKLASVAAGAAT